MAKGSPFSRIGRDTSSSFLFGLLLLLAVFAFSGSTVSSSGLTDSDGLPNRTPHPHCKAAATASGDAYFANRSADPGVASPNSLNSPDSPDSPDSPASLEAVLDTSLGQIVIEFFSKDAPRHVEYFISKAREGAYDGTTFFQLVKDGLIQGGDPLTKNPASKASYGTGGLKAGIRDEINKNRHASGAVSAVLQGKRGAPGEVEPGTSGMQFFIVVGGQPQLDQKFSVFGHVVEGMETATKISEQPASRSGAASERIEIKKVTLREKTPTPDQMKTMHATIETSLGNLKLELTPEGAPNAARSFIRYARSGIYNGTAFYRVSQKYYLEAGQLSDWPQDSPNRKRPLSMWQIPFETNNVKPVRGTASLRQMQGGMVGWDFYIISSDNSSLAGKDAPFARVVEGLDVLDKIAAAEVDGDKPKQRIDIKKVTIE
jgi:peptidyl-prolyl cis-trans isomerase B (cyclophilin B)